MERKVDAVASLISHKAKGGAKDMDGSTPLHYAAAGGRDFQWARLATPLKNSGGATEEVLNGEKRMFFLGHYHTQICKARKMCSVFYSQRKNLWTHEDDFHSKKDYIISAST